MINGAEEIPDDSTAAVNRPLLPSVTDEARRDSTSTTVEIAGEPESTLETTSTTGFSAPTNPFRTRLMPPAIDFPALASPATR